MQKLNSAGSSAIILTFLFPFAGLVYSLCNLHASWAKNAFWMACVYLGAVHIFHPEGTILGSGADGGRYVLDLMNMYNSGDELSSIFARYLIDSQTMDLYQPIVTFLISRFTDNGHVLFGVFAFVFGFFYSRNIWYILERLPNKRLGKYFILIALFFLICPITQINGVRMWTALQVFVYALMPFLLERDKSKLLLLLTVPLIHFSYLYIVILTLIFVLLNRNTDRVYSITKIALLLFVLSLLIKSVNLTSVNAILADYSPESYQERIDMYVNQDIMSRNVEASATTNWYVGASGFLKYWCYAILLIFLYPCIKKYYKNNISYRNLYSFALFVGAFANIMSLIPSGGRFQLVFQMFVVPIILLIATRLPLKMGYSKFVQVISLVLMLPLVVDFRKLFDFYGITAIFGDFFTLLIWESNVPLIDFVKYFII